MTSQEHIPITILAALQDSEYACTTIDRISGGVSNFTYRGHLRTPLSQGQPTVIIKHAEPYIPFAPTFKLDVIRSQFEHSALRFLEGFKGCNEENNTNGNVGVTTPQSFHLDAQNSTQIIQDFAGTTDLKNFIQTQPITESEAVKIGTSLGEWSRAFHTWGAAASQVKFRETMAENKTAVNLKFAVNFGRLVLMVDKFPEILSGDREFFGEVAAKIKANMEESSGIVVHGDFWTGNILVPMTRNGETTTGPLRLVVLDWELCHLSHPAIDLGQLFAELYFLTHFQGLNVGEQIIQAFVKGYGGVGEDMACRVAIHCGVHFINWNGNWNQYGDNKVVEVVRTGRDLVRCGWERNVKALEATFLGCLFNKYS